jgi:hypothetical protein
VVVECVYLVDFGPELAKKSEMFLAFVGFEALRELTLASSWAHLDLADFLVVEVGPDDAGHAEREDHSQRTSVRQCHPYSSITT